MDCKDIQKKIPQYLNDELSGKEILQFINHVDSCSACNEELSIQYLVLEGTARLEDGSGFDLNKELKAKLENSRADVRRRRKMNAIIYTMEVFAFFAIAFILILVIFNK